MELRYFGLCLDFWVRGKQLVRGFNETGNSPFISGVSVYVLLSVCENTQQASLSGGTVSCCVGIVASLRFCHTAISLKEKSELCQKVQMLENSSAFRQFFKYHDGDSCTLSALGFFVMLFKNTERLLC